MRRDLINASKKQFEALREKHKMNVEVYLTNPAGIGAVSYTHLTLPTILRV